MQTRWVVVFALVELEHRLAGSKWVRERMPACSNCISTRYTVASRTSAPSASSILKTSSAAHGRCSVFWKISSTLMRGSVAFSRCSQFVGVRHAFPAPRGLPLE
jgi:hypothetical protein